MGSVPTLLEKHTVKKIRAFLDKQEQTYYFTKEARAIRGIPDIICCVRGVFVALEVKRSKADVLKKGAKLQAYNIEKINKAQGCAFFVYPENLEPIMGIINNIGRDHDRCRHNNPSN